MARLGKFVLFVAAAIACREVNSASLPTSKAFPFSPGFNILKVAEIAKNLPSHSWEYGTAAEALLEIYDPSSSVFGDKPFPIPKLSAQDCPSLKYASTKFQIGAPPNALVNGGGALGDPASLGVSAVLLGVTDSRLAHAAQNELSYLINGAPRFWNGAISHRSEYAELWADFVYMAPPFIAYYGAAHNDIGMLVEAVNQVQRYWEVLHVNGTSKGAWEHIVGPVSPDPGLWSTGNAWAAAGMARVLATVVKAPVCNQDRGWKKWAIGELNTLIQGVLDAAMRSPTQNGLLINYWNDASNKDHRGYGEISGTSLLASVAYRLAVMKPDGLPGSKARAYVNWADEVRLTLGGKDSKGPHITANGTATPAVNPLNWFDTKPWTAGSPEGNNFVVLLYAAWRDCVWAGVCHR